MNTDYVPPSVDNFDATDIDDTIAFVRFISEHEPLPCSIMFSSANPSLLVFGDCSEIDVAGWADRNREVQLEVLERTVLTAVYLDRDDVAHYWTGTNPSVITTQENPT